MSLGKGLESLLPPRNDGARGDNTDSYKEEESPSSARQTSADQGPSSGQSSQTVYGGPASRTSEDRGSPSLSRAPADRSEAIFQIEVERIVPNPHQPRREFNEEALRDLANSIREFGVLQPLVVSKIEEEGENGTTVRYELIAGERRLLASKMVGLRTVPAIIRRVSMPREKLELAVIENIQRENLNPIEEARAYARLQDEFNLTQREIASRLGKSREVIANAMRLLNLPSEVQDALSSGRLNESQARLLLAIEDIGGQKRMLDEILSSNLSVREIRRRINSSIGKETASTNKPVFHEDPELVAAKERLEEILGTKVDLKKDGVSGKITINFYSDEEFESILNRILRKEAQSDY
ncbi:MAG: ParB/RepB/Spo0J family partition protein [Patescibacteria group bacterium]|nr:ParB/RepB/Spo0J family partition protein [Patescibacteria group bacterium]MDE2144824.1 ParB/RepB/Spo0J family partition protein [Patescibacteria group bacterium]